MCAPHAAPLTCRGLWQPFTADVRSTDQGTQPGCSPAAARPRASSPLPVVPVLCWWVLRVPFSFPVTDSPEISPLFLVMTDIA